MDESVWVRIVACIAGLLYEWTHFIVHTHYVPKSRLGRLVRQNHMMHHLRNEGYWLAFTVPLVDKLFGTAPAASSVPVTVMARRAGSKCAD